MKKALMTLLAITLLWSGATTAQQKPSIGLVVQRTDSADHRCGVSDSSLRSIATLTLRNNGISVSDLAFQRVGIQSNGVQTTLNSLDYGCAVDLSVEFESAMGSEKRAEAFQGMTFKPRSGGRLILCTKTALITGRSSEMSQRISAALEESIKLCLGELIY